MKRMVAVSVVASFLGTLVSLAPAVTLGAVPDGLDAGGIADRFRRNVATLWESGDLEGLDEVVDANYRGHTSSGERDRDGLRKRIVAFRSRYSQIHFTVLDQLVVGERVVSRLEARVVDNATAAPATLLGMNISIFRGGKLVEEWAVWETAHEAPH